VVLPDPRNPVRTVTGTRSMDDIGGGFYPVTAIA
jgi:hypothetical protein